MKQLIAATTLAFAVTAAHAQTPESKMPEHIGFGSGAAVGAAVAGPVGVVVGGTLGALIGHDVVQERALARKNQELADLNREIVDARSQLARVNAEQAKTQAELVALQELLQLVAGNHSLLCGKLGQVAHVCQWMALKEARLFGSPNTGIDRLCLQQGIKCLLKCCHRVLGLVGSHAECGQHVTRLAW